MSSGSNTRARRMGGSGPWTRDTTTCVAQPSDHRAAQRGEPHPDRRGGGRWPGPPSERPSTGRRRPSSDAIPGGPRHGARLAEGKASYPRVRSVSTWIGWLPALALVVVAACTRPQPTADAGTSRHDVASGQLDRAPEPADVEPADAPLPVDRPPLVDTTTTDTATADVMPSDVSATDATPTDVVTGPDVQPTAAIPWGVLGLPLDDAGRRVLVETAEGSLRIDPNLRTPERAYAACVAMILECTRATERSEACLMAAPRCATSRPWEEPSACCPAECAAQMARLRGAGAEEFDVFQRVLADDRSCFPGIFPGDAGAP